MNAISPFVTPDQARARSDIGRRPDPASLAIVGCTAAAMLTGAALLAALGEAEMAGPSLGGNVALILFAAINANRPYRRFWAPALALLGVTGATGIALALLPAAELFVTPTAITRFGLESLHGLAQLGAMGMAAFAWAMVRRNTRAAGWSIAAMALLAALQLGQASGLAIAGLAGDAWICASQLLFASWLLATTLGLTRRPGKGRAGRSAPLAAASADLFCEVERYGDRVR